MYRNCNSSSCSMDYLIEDMWAGVPTTYGLNKTHQFFSSGYGLNWPREFGIQANIDRGFDLALFFAINHLC